MTSMTRSLLTVLPVFIIAPTLFGCVAMHRSNTVEYDEHMKVSLVAVVPPEGKQPQGILPIVPMVIGLAKEAASAVLNWEAGKYTQEAVKTVDHIAVPPEKLTVLDGLWELKEPLYLLIVRTVSRKPVEGFWNNLFDRLTWFDHPSELEEMNADLVKDIGDTLSVCDENLTSAVIYRMLGASPKSIPQNPRHSLGFVALLRIVPSKGTATTIDSLGKVTTTQNPDGTAKLQLLAYRYSALKAKNLGWMRVPFVDWHKTSSVLTISIKGPLAERQFSDQRQVATTSFEVTWDRDHASANLPSTGTWSGGEEKKCGELAVPLKESAAIRLGAWRDISIEASIAESNSLKEVWEGLSKRVKEIEVKTKD